MDTSSGGEFSPPSLFTVLPTSSPFLTMATNASNEMAACPEKESHGSPFDTVAYGFIYPVLAIIVLFTNCNGVVVILKMENFTQTNILLLSIFIADLFTTVFPLPRFLFTYSINFNEPILLQYPWCFLIHLLTPIMPTITNNISIWLVSLLSIQRCLCVRNRDLYERLFSQRRIILSIVLISALTFAFHSVLFINKIRFPIPCFINETDYDSPLTAPENNVVTVCNEDEATYIIPNDTPIETIIMSIYYMLRIIVFHILPIIAIATSTALLMFVLFQAQSRIARLSKHANVTSTNNVIGTDGVSMAQMSNAEMIKTELARIEENEYRNAAVHLSERRRRSLGNHLKRPRGSSNKVTTASAKQERKSLIKPSVRTALSSGAAGKTVKKQQRVSTTTHMLVIISTIYLVQHIFMTALFLTGMALNFSESHTEMTLKALKISATIGNLTYVAGFPAAFLLCVAVQEPFREMFYSIYEDNSFANWLQRRKQSSAEQAEPITIARTSFQAGPASTELTTPQSSVAAVPAPSPPPTSTTHVPNFDNNNNSISNDVPLVHLPANTTKSVKQDDQTSHNNETIVYV